MGPFTLTGGTFSGATSVLPGGIYSVAARYAGDAAYLPSVSNATGLTITPEASKVGLQLYFYNVFMNQTGPVTGPVPFQSILYYLAQFQGMSGLGVPSGGVTFTLDGTSLGVYPLDAGGQTAVDYNILSLPTVLPGSHTLVASYDSGRRDGCPAGQRRNSDHHGHTGVDVQRNCRFCLHDRGSAGGELLLFVGYGHGFGRASIDDAEPGDSRAQHPNERSSETSLAG